MAVRVFRRRGDVPAAVEQFNTGCKSGCIVRWDFEPIKTIIPAGEKRAVHCKGQAKEGDDAGMAVEELQCEEVDSGLVSYSETRYLGIPDTERVLADIEKDLVVRYGDAPRPEIDLDAYRSAIAALNKA